MFPSALMESRIFFFHGYRNFLLVLFLLSEALALKQWNSFMGTRAGEGVEGGSENEGTRWAVLVAGSNGFANYRHQADVCHAYQILKKGGLKDENIVVFMYDDIVMHEFNPRPGVVINHPQGDDVYAGVPKDYTGGAVTADNLYAVLLGDAASVKGGTGKVVSSKPNDRIFFYYSDHGGPGVLGMPTMPFVYADDLIDVLKRKHASGNYKEMVLYIEACESGSIFEGMMPENLNIYVTTASNAEESSWGTYCPGMDPPPPPEYATCLADLYSVSWMEDSEAHNLKKETINQQYESVRKRTSNSETYNTGSHVMEYGNKSIKAEKLYLYQGFHPVTTTIPEIKNHLMGVVNQRDADLLFLSQMYMRSEHYTGRREHLLKQIKATMGLRAQLDDNMKLIEALLLGSLQNPSLLDMPRAAGLPLVDDWKCLKKMVMVFEAECGPLSQYGMKYMRVFANICNKGVSVSAMEEVCATACHGQQGSIYLTSL